MNDPGSLTRYALDLHSPERVLREEAARQIWLRFAARLQALIERRLDPRLRRSTSSGDLLQSLFASFFASPPTPDGPPRTRADLWRILVRYALCRVASTANYHRAQKRDYRRVRGLGSDDMDATLAGTRAAGIAERISLGPAEQAEAREEFERLMAKLPIELQQVLAMRLEGYKNAEIARMVGRVERTIELKLKTIRALLRPYVESGRS
jgi:RNA polymerase sigma-70 factor (ECF subfamily)